MSAYAYPALSAYGYLFRARAARFDLDSWVTNLTAVFDEVVVATLAAQEDDTLARLLAYQHSLGVARFRVVVSDIDIQASNRWDGALKTLALQACTHAHEFDGRVYIIMDADERVLPSQWTEWRILARQLLISNQQPDGYLIPVIDLWGSETTVRADRPLAGVKMRMHKGTVVRRGVPVFAERGGGLIDTSRSDTTEPLLSTGELARFASPVPLPVNPSILADSSLPYVLHYGFVDAQRRAELGRTFWKGHWEARSGHPEQVATTVAELTDGVPLIAHHLPLT